MSYLPEYDNDKNVHINTHCINTCSINTHINTHINKQEINILYRCLCAKQLKIYYIALCQIELSYINMHVILQSIIKNTRGITHFDFLLSLLTRPFNVYSIIKYFRENTDDIINTANLQFIDNVINKPINLTHLNNDNTYLTEVDYANPDLFIICNDKMNMLYEVYIHFALAIRQDHIYDNSFDIQIDFDARRINNVYGFKTLNNIKNIIFNAIRIYEPAYNNKHQFLSESQNIALKNILYNNVPINAQNNAQINAQNNAPINAQNVAQIMTQSTTQINNQNVAQTMAQTTNIIEQNLVSPFTFNSRFAPNSQFESNSPFAYKSQFISKSDSDLINREPREQLSKSMPNINHIQNRANFIFNRNIANAKACNIIDDNGEKIVVVGDVHYYNLHLSEGIPFL